MKLNLIAALLLCASVASATSEKTTKPATAAATTAAEKTVPAKKAKKKAKKEQKTEEKTEEKNDGAGLAPATTNSSVSTTSTQTTNIAPANAAATSTAVVPTSAAPTKKWGVSLVNETSADYAQGKDLSNKGVSTINLIGATYKITENERLGLRQYYSYDYNPKAEKNFETSDIKQSFTVATISTKTKGILGSDDISPLFWYYLPGHTAEINNFGKDLDGFQGILRMDAEINWTLNPKWSVSYYFNPRQTLGAKETFTTEEGKPGSFEATSRLVHYANVYYNVSDATQVYLNAGLDHRMASRNLTSTSDRYLSALGVSTSFFGGKLILNPEISVNTPLKTNGAAEVSQNLYNKENIGYTFVTALAL